MSAWFAWGSGSDGQLGHGDTLDYAEPRRIPESAIFHTVHTGGCHSAAITNNEELFTWGSNSFNQLGYEGNENTKPTLVQSIGTGERADLVACGWSHIVAVLSDRNKSSQRFLILNTDSSSPLSYLTFPIPISVKAIACGWKHSLLVSNCGQVFAWGSGRLGELGLGPNSLVASEPNLIPGVNTAKAVFCGWQHSLIQLESNEVLATGSNRHGQLGILDEITKNLFTPQKLLSIDQRPICFSKISVGWHHTLGLFDGIVYSWGKGSYGQLGHGDNESIRHPQKIHNTPSHIIHVTCGSEHSLFLTSSGVLYSFGWGEHGNLGHKNQDNVFVPKPISYFQENNLQVKACTAAGAVSIALAELSTTTDSCCHFSSCTMVLGFVLLAVLVYAGVRLYTMDRKILINWVANSVLFYFFHMRNVKKYYGQRGYQPQSYEEEVLDGKAAVVIVPFLEDNYAYIIIDKATGDCALVDPADPFTTVDVWREVALRWNEKLHLRLKYILTTHKHFDHAGGNKKIKEVFPDVTIVGGILDNVLCATKLTWHKDAFKIGNLLVETLALPCHTVGHIAYHVTIPGNKTEGLVFTGDTLFVAGTGRFFEGNGEQMYRNLTVVLGSLPKSTKVYCGHEYTLNNLAFASFVEPGNEAIKNKISWAIERRKMNRPTVPSTLGEELDTNPFMRTDHANVAHVINTHHQGKHPKQHGELMQCLREMKDNDVHQQVFEELTSRLN
ncbi:hypothetical protein THRCLA_09900 [Thraustotheca clavata]|uniref:hydroxyacylglutathione hydrolase n=1 Tax=Thraustotheca clavata TaxID=74557 RepID=A0A1V9YTQ6_9STRA|nr:hypothetical protein THRCLA_09900 [Thraustotheca clavata]